MRKKSEDVTPNHGKQIAEHGVFKPMRKTGTLPKAMPEHDLLIDLLQAVIDDDNNSVIKILNKTPELLKLEPGNFEIQSQLTWQKFKAKHPLIIALKRNQVEMVGLLMSYFEKLEDGIDTAFQQWGIAEREVAKAKKESKKIDFGPLIDIIDEEKFPHGLNKKAMLSRKTEEALTQFRATMLKEIAVYDIEELLQAAFSAYENNFDRFRGSKAWHKRSVFNYKVICFILSFLSRKVAEVWCQGLESVVEHSQEIGASTTTLTLYGGQEFYRNSFDSSSGLGFDCPVGALNRGAWWPQKFENGQLEGQLLEGQLFKKLIHRRQDALEKLEPVN